MDRNNIGPRDNLTLDLSEEPPADNQIRLSLQKSIESKAFKTDRKKLSNYLYLYVLFHKTLLLTRANAGDSATTVANALRALAS